MVELVKIPPDKDEGPGQLAGPASQRQEAVSLERIDWLRHLAQGSLESLYVLGNVPKCVFESRG